VDEIAGQPRELPIQIVNDFGDRFTVGKALRRHRKVPSQVTGKTDADHAVNIRSIEL
jgi:hypothetical protein